MDGTRFINYCRERLDLYQEQLLDEELQAVGNAGRIDNANSAEAGPLDGRPRGSRPHCIAATRT
jgi:hypothetical protein